MVHRQILHELYEELEFLKHDGNPADRQTYDAIEKAIFPIVSAARKRVLAAGKPIPASLQAAITATDKRLVEKQEEARFAAVARPAMAPQPRMMQRPQMAPQPTPMGQPAPMTAPPPRGRRSGFKRAYSNNINDWI